MKKLLLMVAMTATTMCGFAQVPELTGEDITPSKYKDWAGGTCVTEKFYGKPSGNFDAPVITTINTMLGYEYDGNGMVAWQGAAAWGGIGADASRINAGVAIVDLGGEVGKVWAFSGTGSKASEKFGGFEFPKATSLPGWYNINFFGDPSRTTKGGEGNTVAPTNKHMNVKIIMNICPNPVDGVYDAAKTLFKSIYTVHDDGAMVPDKANVAANTAVTIKDFVEYDEDAEAVVYNKNKWLVYEFDTWCPDDDKEGKSYAPLRIKMEMDNTAAANLKDATLFIKEIRFTEVEGAPTIPANEHKHTYITLKPEGTPKLVTGVNSVTVDAQSNDMIYNLAGQRVQNAQNGIFIQNGKKVIK